MKNLSKVAVIGSSDQGYEITKDIVGKIKLGKESSIILVPHICAGYIYEDLLEKGKKVHPILNNQIIEPQSIYVGMENPTNLLDSNYYGLRRKLGIEKENGNYKFSLGKDEIAYINEAFYSVADAFKEKSMGVILYGIGSSGAKGLSKIKEVGGKSLVQKIDEKDPHYKISMPRYAIQHCDVDYILFPDELCLKLEEMLK